MEKTVLISLPIEDLQTVIIDCVNSCLKHNSIGPPSTPSEELLTVPQIADYLTLSVHYVYKLISRGELPVMKRGKRVYASKADLFAYLKEGRNKTNSEIEAEASRYVTKKRGPK